MNIWIFQSGEPLPIDKNSRPMRAINLTQALIEANHNIVLWSSDFYHQKSTHRFKSFRTIKYSKNLNVELIPSIGYKKNIGPKRLLDHLILALNFFKALNKNKYPKPDFVFIGYPPIETAFILTLWLKKRNIFSFIDIKDLWPEIFLEAIPKKLSFIGKYFLFPYYKLAEHSFKNASAILGPSDEYINWALDFCKRPRNKYDQKLPLVSAPIKLSNKEIVETKLWWKRKGIDLNSKKRFCFIGNINNSYNFHFLNLLAKKFEKEKIDCEFVICGKGDKLPYLKSIFGGLKNTIFPGWINHKQITTLMENSIGSIAPYKDIPNFNLNLTNKFIDSFSNKLPVITSLKGDIKDKLYKEKVCLFCDDTLESWEKQIRILLENEALQKEMSNNCERLYLREFTYKVVYKNFVKRMEKINNH